MYYVRLIRGPRSDADFATFEGAWNFLVSQVDGLDAQCEAGQVWLDEGGNGRLVVVATYDPANAYA